MKKLILIVLGAILVTLAASTMAMADCDTPDPGDPTSFE
jgi:hypothetical protein